jgi:outer membrane protein assembly factor BamA
LRIAAGISALVVGLTLAAPAAGQDPAEVYFGQTVLEVRFENEEQPDAPLPNVASLRELVDVQAGSPLRREDVRTSMDHLFALGRYEDVRPLVVPGTGGVIVVFRLLPRYPIGTVDVSMSPGGPPTGPLTNELRQRFSGRPPGVVRTEAVEDTAVRLLGDLGYLAPEVTAATVVEPGRDEATLVVKINPGPLALIARSELRNASPLSDASVLRRTASAPGQPYRRRELETRLTEIEDELRTRGYYEAQSTIEATPGADGVDLVIGIQAGPRVELRVTPPDVVPGDIDELIPVEQQRSADEDLLEDARANIEAALKREGYAEATAPFTRELSADGTVLVVSFAVSRGPRYFVERVDVPPGLSISEALLRDRIAIKAGELYDEARFLDGLRAVIEEYRRLGYFRSEAIPGFQRVPERTTALESWVVLQPGITEGPRARLSNVAVAFEGTHQIDEGVLRQSLRSVPGAPYVELNALVDLESLRAFYRDRGFLSAGVGLERRLSPDETSVDLFFTINEGPQITIGRITVLGNERLSEQQILEQLDLQPGQPLSMSALSSARQRLADMGVFRSFTVEAADRIGGETEGHIVITVVEAPARTIGFGLGIEAGSRARRAEDGSALDDVIEFVPRGFFEIGRQHLGGRNRAVNLFTRVGLRRSDRENLSETVQEFQFTEYRVTGTYRERNAFRSQTDLLVGLTSEQSVRPTYNYLRQFFNAEFLRRVGARTSVSGRYVLDFTRLFDERIPEADQPLIDRLFPQVRLSYVSTGVSWDGRDNPLTPARGTFVSADAWLAARSLASEVGYIKGFFQASNFRPVGGSTSTVFAVRGQLGMARGFERDVTAVDAGGVARTETVRDVPVSQRFFAGGGTTVRGFPLDRLGVFDPDCVPCSVLNPTTGLSVGGNAVIVLNAELRRSLTRISDKLAVVAFLDGGNVFPSVTDLDLGRIRGGTGFGVRYDSPFGPLRLDVGFKLNRLVLGERRESAWEYHLSIGEAF